MTETASERSVNSRVDPEFASYVGTMSLSEFADRLVLVVDDEPMVREVVTNYLTTDGFRVHEAADGASALEYLRLHQPDLVILDIMLPGVDGFSLLKSLRHEADVPVIMLTARSDEADRVLGLELGADDYVVKPFSPRELSARVRAVLKRAMNHRQAPGSVIVAGDLTMNAKSRQVWVCEREIDLKPREFELLSFLASSPRQVFSRGQLLRQVWDSDASWQDPSTVTVHIRRIRQAIEPNPDKPRYVTTVWGVGYRYEP